MININQKLYIIQKLNIENNLKLLINTLNSATFYINFGLIMSCFTLRTFATSR